MSHKRTRILFLSLSAGMALALSCSPPAFADERDDATFSSILYDNGFTEPVDETTIGLGREACRAMTERGEGGLAAFVINTLEDGMSVDNAASLISASVIAYCPENLRVLRNAAERFGNQNAKVKIA